MPPRPAPNTTARSSNAFLEMKANGAKTLDRIRQALSFSQGTHKKTRLRQAVRGNWDRTILADRTAAEHAGRLKRRFDERLNGLSEPEAQERLGFLTVLHAMTPLDPTEAMESAAAMERTLRTALTPAHFNPKAWMLGAIEVEVVNYDVLAEVERAKGDEKRKLTVLRALGESRGEGWSEGSLALVHFHGLVDFGPGSQEADRTALRNRLKRDWRAPYAVELKSTFKGQHLRAKLHHIAAYLTKGGNEALRYKTGWGRELAADVEAKMAKRPGSTSTEPYEAFPDERGLTVGEVQFLDETYWQLMTRLGDRDGYLVCVEHKG